MGMNKQTKLQKELYRKSISANTEPIRPVVMHDLGRNIRKRQLSPALPDNPTHDKITPTIPAKCNGLRCST